ncbi:MAG: hypothetical protein AB7F19_01630 [Candidatus Babeliales bacterium]
MLQRPRLRKLALCLLILILFDEIVIQKCKPIAPAVALAPIAYETILLSAAAATSIYSAYLLTQISDPVLRTHSQTLPTIAQELKEIFPSTPSHVPHSPDFIAQALEESVGQASYKKAYKSQFTKIQEQSLINTINTNIVHPAIARNKHINSIPSQQLSTTPLTPSLPSSPIQFTYQPNAIHFEVPHINTYGSIAVTEERPLSSVRQQIINNCHEHALDEFLFNERCKHIPGYLANFTEQLNEIILVFHDLVSEDIYKRTHACLIFPHISIEGPFNYTLQNVIHELIPFYFDTEGKLERLFPHNKVTHDFIIAKFLKNGINRSTYLQLLKTFNFKEVLEHEENLGSYLWNGVKHTATGAWLPSLTWYPRDIKKLISHNNFNHGLEQILTLCSKNKFVEAQNIVNSAGLEVLAWQELYQQCYHAFKSKYCDSYGILIEYLSDPLWANATNEAKAELARNIMDVTTFNNALAVRSIQKKSIEKSWGIASDAPTCVHNAVYCLIDLLGTGTEFIDKVHELIAQEDKFKRDALIEALFLPNGILKDFSHFSAIDTYHFPKDILTQPKLLKKINTLFYQQHIFAGSEQGTNAAIKLNTLQAIYDTRFSSNIPQAKTSEYWPFDQENTNFKEQILKRALAVSHYLADYSNTMYKSVRNAILDIAPSLFLANENTEPTPQNEPPPGEQVPFEEDAPTPETKPDSEEEVIAPEVVFEPTKPSKSTPSSSGSNLLDPSNGTPPLENEPSIYYIPRELPNDPEDWAKEKNGIKPWVPPSSNWKSEQAKAYLQFLGQGFLRTGLAAMGIPFEDFEYALEIFKNIPGFLSNNSAFQQIIRYCYRQPIKNWHQIKGFIYEIQTALRVDTNREQIIEFGRKVPSGEIDIITTTRFIECKNIKWENNIDAINDCKNTIGKQIKHIHEELGKRLTVFSKEPLPQELKNWFIKKNIEYFEG